MIIIYKSYIANYWIKNNFIKYTIKKKENNEKS